MRDVRGSWSHYIVVWFKVARKPGCISFIKNYKGKGLVVTRKDISTPSVPYMR